MLSYEDIKAFIPNSISLLRFFLSIFFVFCITNKLILVSLVIFIIAALTDFLDGYLARLWKVESVLGGMLDPFADKCLIIFTFITLTFYGIIPLLLTIVVVTRDLAILFVVCLCRLNNVRLEFHPLYSSKVNTTIQLLYVILVLFCHGFMIDVPLVVYGFSLIVGVSTIFSAVQYAKKYYWIKDAICSYK
ncbi:MAG: CDP-alcohol phosphatidyltransferase family protein [Alphaproteobacteria bacterium]|nr:CDP-alcohol phosphatidyltransferase family protein [Alphaproteobacteria bacterium]